MTLTACNNALFSLMNAKIKRGIRNEENRATNCVANNIRRAVDAATKYCTAIDALERAGRLASLPNELRETALLRREHPEVSLEELAHMHNPPITKSGLNHRLQKILAAAITCQED